MRSTAVAIKRVRAVIAAIAAPVASRGFNVAERRFVGTWFAVTVTGVRRVAITVSSVGWIAITVTGVGGIAIVAGVVVLAGTIAVGSRLTRCRGADVDAATFGWWRQR